MLPLVIDIALRKIVLVGSGPALKQRYGLAHEGGAERISIFVLEHDGWACNAVAHVRTRLPEATDFEGAAIVFIAGLPDDESARLARQARAAGALVNVEDVLPLCDFHVPALVRRGDLVISVSTGGRSPGLARTIRGHLQRLFGPEWTDRTRRIAAAREAWRGEGVPKDEIVRRTGDIIKTEGWLKDPEVS